MGAVWWYTRVPPAQYWSSNPRSRYQLRHFWVRPFMVSSPLALTATGRHPGRRAQALLRRAVGEVDVNVVEVHAGAAERGHCVDEEKGVVVVGQLAEVAQWLEHAGRGLGVDSGQQLHLRLLLEDGLDCVGVGGLAPLHRYGDDLGPLARSDLREAHPKKAILDNDGHVTRLQEVGERRLHARGARTGDGQREGVLRAKDLTQHLRDAVHDLDELGVQVAKDGR